MGISGDAAGDDNILGIGVKLLGELEFFEEDVDGGLLEGGGKIGNLLRGEERGELVGGERDGLASGLLNCAENSGFKAREGEVKIRLGGLSGLRRMAGGAGEARVRKMILVGVAGGDFKGGAVGFGDVAVGGGGNVGTARVGKTEDFGDLIEAFADGVVAGGADNVEMVVFGHIDNLGVTATDDEGEKGEAW